MSKQREQSTDSLGRNATAEALAHLVALRAVTYLAGPVSGRTVLDLACGDGTLSRWLAVHGAYVTGVDSSVQSVEGAKTRDAHERHGISYLAGDPQDLYMIDDSAFDDVLCNLSLGRVQNLGAAVAEVARIIRFGGRFIFSVGHPCFEQQLLGGARKPPPRHNYFAEDLRSGLFGPVRHRTLATYINAVAARGFTVRRVLEPSAEERDVSANPNFHAWRRAPIALVIEAVFPRL